VRTRASSGRLSDLLRVRVGVRVRGGVRDGVGVRGRVRVRVAGGGTTG
jgi:hypothetical protein